MPHRSPLTALLPGSITRTYIADGAIATPQLAANAITADKIAAGTITAGALRIGFGDNLVPDGTFADARTVTYRATDGKWVPSSAGNPYAQSMVIAGNAAGGGSQLLLFDPVTIRPTESIWWRFGATSNGNPTGSAYLAVQWLGATGASVGGSVVAYVPAAPGWQLQSGRVAAPVGAAAFRLYLETAGQTSGQWLFTAVEARRAISGDLLVDGAIDGKVITGATMRTSAPAVERLELGPLVDGAIPFPGLAFRDPTNFLRGSIYRVGTALTMTESDPDATSSLVLDTQQDSELRSMRRLRVTAGDAIVLRTRASLGTYKELIVDVAGPELTLACAQNSAQLRMAAVGVVSETTTGTPRNFYGSGFVVTSDARAKDIDPTPPNCLAIVKGARAKRWRYKQPAGEARPATPRIGPIAQDLPADLVQTFAQGDDGPETKALDVATVAGIAWGAARELLERVETLEKALKAQPTPPASGR